MQGQIATSHSGDGYPKFKESSSIQEDAEAAAGLITPTPPGIILTNIRFPKGVIVFTLMVIRASFNFP